MTENELPSLYQCANRSSVNAQRAYLRVLKMGIVLQVIGVAFSLYRPCNPSHKAIPTFVAASCFFLSLIVTIILKTKQFEQIWYGGRAVAESVKTSAWRYAVGSAPYARELPEESTDEIFINNLRAILEQKAYLAHAVAGDSPSGQQITSAMRTIRNLTTNARRKLYMEQRILNQQKWYAVKAGENKRAANKLFALFIFAQVATVLCSLVQVAQPDFLDLTGISALIATSALAWLQVKRHQELSQSYAVTAHELSFVVERGRHIKTDSDLAKFVADAEMAISREHTLWVARRETL